MWDRLTKTMCPDCGRGHILFNGGTLICENYCGFQMSQTEGSKFWWGALIEGVDRRIAADRKLVAERELDPIERDSINRRIQSFENIRADAVEKKGSLPNGS